jgi:hypothetical protein
MQDCAPRISEEDCLPRRRFGLGRLVAAMALLMLVILLLHGPLLRAVYGVIVFDQSTRGATHGILLFGDAGSLESVAHSIREGELRKAVIVELKPSRSVRIGAAPRLAAIARQELKQKGVPESAIDLITTDATSFPAAIRAVNERLEAGTVAAVPCPRHASRHVRTVIDAVLDEPNARRFYVQTVPVSGFDERRWWISRTGIKRVVSSYLRLLHLKLVGLREVDATEWDPDAYEIALRGDG